MHRDRPSSGRAIAPVDAAIAALVLVLGQLEVTLYGVEGDPLAAHALWAVVAACALFRRRRPLLFALAAVAATALRYRYGLTPTGGAIFAVTLPLALYGLGAFGRDPLRSAALAGGVLLLNEAVSAAIALSGHGPMAHLPAVEWLGQFSIHFAAAAGGIALRDRAEVLREARARVAATPSDAEAADAALLEERTRIARELHAVVSASVRELLGEIEHARAQLRPAPTRAGEALHSARIASRRALEEMRRMLSLLRAPDPPPARTEAAAAKRERLPLERVPTPLRAQGLALLVLGVEVLGTILSHSHPELYGSASLPVRLLGAVALAAAFLPRRRLPLLTAVAVGAIVLVRVVVLDDFFALNLALYLAAFSAGAYGRPFAVAVAGVLVLAAAAVATPLLVGLALPFGVYAFIAITVGGAWATGVGGRRRLAEAAELRKLAEEERHRNARAVQRAVGEERLRVARELHDLVGHGLTSIVLQCAAAERLVEERPSDALTAIAAVEEVGAEIETELAELLAALEGSESGEAPRLARMPELIRRAEATGMRVELELAGDVERVDAGPAGAAYRIVQEGLTNARKHGADDRAVVHLAVEGGCLRVAIENAVAARNGGGGEGHGLIGISERVRVYGGSFRAGTTERGTWSVEAELPLAPAPAESRSPTLTRPPS